QPVLLRFAHEMNGDWYPWCQEPENFKKAFVYIYSVIQNLKPKTSNLKLVWCPNNNNIPNEAGNNIAAYYPGDEYVDWVGVDGYNWGYERWETFDQVFLKQYRQLIALTSKPVMIGEFGSAEAGGDKGAWIKESLAKIKNEYPQIKLFCWFNINKERDWRIDEAAMRHTLRDSYFSDKIVK
ncbi:MAG: glycosyl hydrolase, partial [bacterium]